MISQGILELDKNIFIHKSANVKPFLMKASLILSSASRCIH